MTYTVCAARSFDRWSILRIPLTVILCISFLFGGMILAERVSSLLKETVLGPVAFSLTYMAALGTMFWSLFQWRLVSLRKQDANETRYVISKDFIRIISPKGEAQHRNHLSKQRVRKGWNRLTIELDGRDVTFPSAVDLIQPEPDGMFMTYSLVVEEGILCIKGWRTEGRNELVGKVLAF